jgi:manganese/iron transport system permease protein
MILGVGVAVTSSVAGMYLSYFYNLPSGPAIVLVTSGIFILAFLFSPSQGVFTHPRSNSGQIAIFRELKGLILANRK